MSINKKYYLIYAKNTRDIYAYTDDEELYLNFSIIRNMDLFYVKTVNMSKDDIKELFYSDRNFHILIGYKFIIDGVECVISITNAERSYIESSTAKNISIDIFTKSIIPPNIFNKKIRKHLYDIGYIQAYLYYSEGKDTNIFKENLIGCFIKEFGYTMKGSEK